MAFAATDFFFSVSFDFLSPPFSFALARASWSRAAWYDGYIIDNRPGKLGQLMLFAVVYVTVFLALHLIADEVANFPPTFLDSAEIWSETTTIIIAAVLIWSETTRF